MKKLSPLYATIGIFTAITLAIVGLLIYPTFHSIWAKAQEALSARQEVVGMALQADEIERFKKAHEHYQEDLESLNQILVNSEDPVEFITFLEGLAARNNLFMEISLPQNGKDDQSTASGNSFKITTGGTFQGIVQFVQQLETGSYLVSIDSIQLQKITKGAGNDPDYHGPVKGDLTIKVVTN